MGRGELQTEDYRPGALGGAAQGYGLKSKALRYSPGPKAGSPTAPGR